MNTSNMKIYKIAFLILSGLAVQQADAKVTLPDVIAPGMIVQRGEDVRLWGKADPGEEVTAACNKRKVKVTADASGNWQLSLPALKPGGPYTITVNDVVLDNVLSGDVFLCSGQSNMELPVRRVAEMFADEVASYSNDAIRQFNVKKEISFNTGEDNAPGSWNSMTPSNALNFSAIGYFFAKELNARTGVPIGIINSSWGGTPIEAWTSREFLVDYPMALSQLHIYDDEGYRTRIKQLEGENYARWNATLWAGDPGVNSDIKWYGSNVDDSDWDMVVLPGHYGDSRKSWGGDGLNAVNGSHWFRKSIDVPADAAGKDAVLRLGCIVDADSVFFNGTFVGTTGYQYPPRIYNIPGELVRPGANRITVRLISQYGFPEFVSEKPYKFISGETVIDLSGEWKYRRGAVMPQGPGMEFYCYVPTVLYNKMIAPLSKMPVSGVLWYQGESNVSRRNIYADQLVNMIDNWRQSWDNPDMPFYIVELADFLHESDVEGRESWNEMRQQQRKAVEMSTNTWLVPNADLGEWNDIHPLDKKTPGVRAASIVLESKKLKK